LNDAYLGGDNKLVIYSIGTTVQVTATYHTYEYDNNGNELGTLVAVGPVVGVKEATFTGGSILAYTVVDVKDDGTIDSPDWKKVNQQVAVEDRAQIILKLKDTNDKEFVSTDNTFVENFTFTTSKNDVLIVDNDGRIYPVSQGSAVVVVKYGDNMIGTVTITVTPERKGTILTLTPQRFTLSNSANANDQQVVEAKLVDQYQKDVEITSIKAEYVSGVENNVIVDYDYDENKVIFKPVIDGSTGASNYKITVNDKVSRYVNITVAKPNGKNDLSDVKYRIDLAKSFDLAVKDDTNVETSAIEVKLFGYAPNGVKATDNVVNGYKVEILDPDGKQVSDSAKLNLYTPKVVSGDVVSGTVIEKIKTGNYRVIVKDGEKVVHSAYFNVTDTQAVPSLAEIKTVEYTAGTILEAAKECFVIKLDGKELKIVDVDYVGSSTMTGDKRIKSVKVEQKINGGYVLLHEVKIGMTIVQK